MSGDYGWGELAPFGCLQPPDPCLTITLDGIEFTGSAPQGFGYGITGWSGWIDGAEATGGPAPYELRDGGYETPLYGSGRTITLEGVIVARTGQELWEASDALGRILAIGRWAPMVVTEDQLGLERMMRVCRTRKPMITPRGSRRAADFTLEVQSARWEKLSPAKHYQRFYSGQAFPVENQGDYPGQMNAELVGPLTNPQLSWPGGSWTYRASIPAGEKRTVTFWDRNVRNPATTANSRLAVAGDWPYAQPGSHSYTLTGQGAGYVDLWWWSAWS
ncbi:MULTISPECIES: hypothetical protein [unclassified Luteococcus]|uniref:hypothetical protein n=1 Tax=unclassified Luteococcus TaxID=2639923 RepID=UPI00313BCCE9